ncbi:MAG: segregation and condensation protein A [Kiritimatiellia bacterium]
MAATPTEPTDDYKIELDVFEGPLDLLLYLIRRDELDIYDIPIERVTTQYLEYLQIMRMLDLNIAGEFLVMAATLMMIKSRMLLPVEDRVAEDEAEEEWIDPRLDLVRQLIEYKKFKDAAAHLLDREIRQAEIFGPGCENALLDTAADSAQMLGDIGLFDLLTAFQEMLKRAPIEPLGHLEPIRWSVPDKIEDILSLTRRQGAVGFSRLFHAESPRGEIIVTFLALLELLRLRQVTMRQSAAFLEIMILPLAESVPETQQPPPVIGGGEHVTT